MLCLPILSRSAVTLLVLTLSISQGHCQKETASIDNFLVTFVPPVTIYYQEKLLNCTGVIVSPKHIALYSVCATNARRLRQTQTVVIQNYQGHYIGQLTAIDSELFEAVQSLLESKQRMPFVGEPESSGAFPTFAEVGELESNDLASTTYYIERSDSQQSAVVHCPVYIQKLLTVKGKFALTGLGSAFLEQYPIGSPVVDGDGGIMCFLAEDGGCELVSARGAAINDGSCQISYFECRNVTWALCEEGIGNGTCINNNQEVCNVVVVPNLSDDPRHHCRNEKGCGIIECPSGCDTSCVCSAAWGSCELGFKTIVDPPACMAQQGGGGGVDSRCPATQPTAEPTSSPNDFRHSSTFLGVVISLPIGVIILSGIVITAIIGITYKYQRAGYESVQ